MIVSTSGLAIVLAVLGAICFAGAAVLQHRAISAGSARTSGDLAEAPSLGRLLTLTRQTGWLTGLGLAAGGTGLHAFALVLAPLPVVQPVGVLAVPIAVLLTTLLTGRMPGRGVLVGVLLSGGGVATFVVTSAATAGSTPAPDGRTLVASLIAAGIVLLLAGIGRLRPGWTRCVARATAGAVAFGLLSALVRATSQSITAGGVGLLDPSVLAAGLGIGIAVLVGGWLVQQAFVSGPPEVVIACLTVVDPIVAVTLGAVLLGEGAATPSETWLRLLSAAVAAAGVISLARHHPDAVAARARASVGAGGAGGAGLRLLA